MKEAGWWFQTHCSEIGAHLKMVSLCPFLWRLIAQTAVFIWFSSPRSFCPGLALPMLCTITYPTRWKERGTIRFIPELVHNLASALALRAPLLKEAGLLWWISCYITVILDIVVEMMSQCAVFVSCKYLSHIETRIISTVYRFRCKIYHV